MKNGIEYKSQVNMNDYEGVKFVLWFGSEYYSSRKTKENKEENQVPVEQPANPVEIQISEPINVPEEKSVSDIVTPAEEKPKKKSFFGMSEFHPFNRSPSSPFHLEEPPLWLVHIACACVQLGGEARHFTP